MLTEFFAVTDLTTNPDPVLSAYHVSYVVWAPRTPLALYLAHDQPLARGRPVGGGAGLRPALSAHRARGQPSVASRPRRSPSSSDQVRTDV